jgi:hypothetical protein
MSAEAVGRLVIALVVLCAIPVVWRTYLALRRRQLQEQRTSVLGENGVTGATVLYFWSETCTQCKPQERQIEEARIASGRKGIAVHLRKINALENADLARSMHVMTVPTTVVVDGRGSVVAWNPGLTLAEKLVSQFAQTVPAE